MQSAISDQPYLAYTGPKSSSPHEESSGCIPVNPKIWQSGPKSWAWLWSVPEIKQGSDINKLDKKKNIQRKISEQAEIYIKSAELN